MARPAKNAQLKNTPDERRRLDKSVMMEAGEMSKFIKHSLWSYYAEPINLNDPKQVEKRIGEYFNHCMEDDMKPTVMGICNSLGISRATFHEWCTGGRRGGEYVDIIKKAKDFLEEMMESYMVNGKVNPVTGIFLLKNNFGYRDQQEVVLKPTMELGDQTSPEDLQKKYLEATGTTIDCEAESVE